MTVKPSSSPLSAAVAQRVRALRKQNRWSAQHLANLLRENGNPIARSTLAKIEAGGRADVTVDELYAFAQVFGVKPEQMVSGPCCASCNDAPPMGFSCLNCGASGQRSS